MGDERQGAAERDPLLLEEATKKPPTATGESGQVSYASTSRRRSTSIICVGLGGLVVLAVGLIVGVYLAPVIRSPPDAYVAWENALRGEDESISAKLLQNIKTENIESHLRYLTSRPHVAGTYTDKENAEYVKEELLKAGVDSVEIHPYDILLSYPDLDNPNKVQILDENDTVIFTTHLYETPLTPDENVTGVIPPFNSYAPNGTVEGEVVFANFGEIEDFLRLERELNVSVRDKIVLVKYGKIFRGDKVKFAEQFGARGVVMYSDPATVAPNGIDNVYPNSWWLPGTAVERGTLWALYGDPITPAYPSIDGAYREPEENIDLPKIPAQPIGYQDAAEILRNMEGREAPKEWWGALNITYRLGPALQNNRKLKLEVTNINQRNYTYTTVGYIRGSLEPDRYVILGNHRDAWILGALDPSSGTASMLEIARAMVEVIETTGWRPRRSIVFCSWGGEEHGVIGSPEWVEEHVKILTDNAVVYINVDITVEGNFVFRSKATPNLNDVLYKVTKKIKDASDPKRSIYDVWLERAPSEDGKTPMVSNIGSGSDYVSFMSRVGISSMDFRYIFDGNFVDPDFTYQATVAKVWAEMARVFADALVLPFDCTGYGLKMADNIRKIEDRYGALISERGLSFEYINKSLEEFIDASIDFHSYIERMKRDDPFVIRKVNDHLMYLDRTFLDPAGLPDRPLYKHVVFAPSSKDVYSGDAFPGLLDALFDIENTDDPDEQWRRVEKHMSVVAYFIHGSAIKLKSAIAEK
ncbi:N-acetylated-alpha-linked acidic dipeptidase 2-like isoform X2 [Ptychodera flava]|uniref:N-acetylated-alpha-linked acidic dipeptidase 2-like isoform X2 n=1 Tax=Ptychodera flava TaxID=63121 RepID=UPI00396A7575